MLNQLYIYMVPTWLRFFNDEFINDLSMPVYLNRDLYLMLAPSWHLQFREDCLARSGRKEVFFVVMLVFGTSQN